MRNAEFKLKYRNIMKKANFSGNNVQSWQRKLIFGIVIIMSFVIITVQSCTKDSTGLNENTVSSLSAKDMTAMERVNHFNSVVDKTGLDYRDGLTYTGADAVLGVETLLNYEYDDFTKRYDNTSLHKDTVTIDKNNGLIDDTVIEDIYDNVLSLMECHFGNINETNKKEMFVDIELVSENSQQIQVGMTNVVGFFSAIPYNGNLSFGTGEDWKASFGKCDGTILQIGAPEIIASYTTWNVGVVNSQPGVWYDGQRKVDYNNEDYTTWYGINPNDPTISGDYILDYFMWYADFCNGINDLCESHEVMIWESYVDQIYTSEFINVMCIEYDEMNYYLANAESEALKYETILSKEFLHFEMFYEEELAIDDINPSWHGFGTYGVKIVDKSRVPKTLASCK